MIKINKQNTTTDKKISYCIASYTKHAYAETFIFSLYSNIKSLYGNIKSLYGKRLKGK